ncbi:MAG: helix-turn-helix transcriptional regulator [Candidatus Methanomethylophilaceae archaeon]|nr:helix-turn-helix transcriptional regulator [Candidatus Methanomethylophilaceae archaeon]
MKPYLELSDIFQEISIDQRMIELASRFKVYRKKAKLTQIQLADRSGVSYGTIKRFERTGKISLESLWLLTAARDCDDQLDQLFGTPALTADDLRG